MKKFLKITGIVLGILLLLIGGFAAFVYYRINNIKDTHDLQTRVDELCNKYVAEGKAPGLFVGIVQGDKVYVKGYGLTDKDNGAAPDSNTIFEIGSISKVFTTEIVQRLTEEGQMNWDDNIAKYMPQQEHLPKNDSTTLRHLASHTSGYPRLPEMWFGKLEENECDPYSVLTMNDLYTYLSTNTDKKAPSPDNYEYSNLGAGILGHIAEWKTGKTYETLLQEYICNPLGMNNTSLQVKDSTRFATGYDEKGKKTCHWAFPILYSAGAIRSTGADMLRFLKANMGYNGALSTSFKKTHEDVTDMMGGSVGLGWHIDKAGGIMHKMERIVWHNGGTGGFRSHIAFVPGTNKGMILLANGIHEDFDELAMQIMFRTGNISLK